MEKSSLPKELAIQLEEIKKQNRQFTGIVVVLVSILAVIIVYWFSENQSYASLDPGNTNNVVQLSASGAAASGGCCGGSGSSGSSGGGCGSSGGGGCGSGTATQVSSPELEKQVLARYKAEFGDKEGIRAVVMDLGCHQEVNIIDKDNNLLKRYSFRGGQLTLI